MRTSHRKTLVLLFSVWLHSGQIRGATHRGLQNQVLEFSLKSTWPVPPAPILQDWLLALQPLQERPVTSPGPVNPDTLPDARQLLEYFYAVRGKHILAGQHNYPGTLSAYTDEVFELTGRFPVIWGQDFGFTAEGKDGIVHRDAIIQEAIKRYQQGYIVTLMWHAVRPTDNEPNGWKSSVQNELEQARTLYKDSRVLTRCQVQWRR